MWVILLLFLTILILGLVFIPLNFISNSNENINNSGHLQIIAHRGASGVAPENTFPAFDSAIAENADFIELDIHLSKDNKVIVMHDYTVDRTTNGTGSISELTSGYIKSLDAGKWFSDDFTGTRVPFLDEVIKQVDGQTKLLIEIKEKREANTGIEKEVVKLIEKYGAESWCVIQSFNDESLKKIHETNPKIELHKLFFVKFRLLPYVFDGKFTYFDFKKYEYISAFNIHRLFAEDEFLEKIHANGKKVNAWGCGSRGSCKQEKMKLWNGVITNFPGDYSK